MEIIKNKDTVRVTCKKCGSDDNFWIDNFGRFRHTELCGKCIRLEQMKEEENELSLICKEECEAFDRLQENENGNK